MRFSGLKDIARVMWMSYQNLVNCVQSSTQNPFLSLFQTLFQLLHPSSTLIK